MTSSKFNEVKLGDVIISANTGLDAIKRAPIVDYNTGIKCLRIQDISQNKLFDSWGFCEVEENNFNRFSLKKGDILVARTGATIGVNIQIKDNLTAVYNNGLIRLKINNEIANNKFVFYNLQTQYYKNFINAISAGTSTQPNMQINSLLSFEIPFPPLEIQEKIARILLSLDDKIELNNKINQNLEQQAQAIFKSWFVDFENPKRKTCKAEEYFSISIGKTPPRKEPEWFSLNSIDKKWVSISDMGNCGVFILNSSEYLKDSAIDKFNIVLVPKDTVILSFKLTVGRVAITNEEMTTNEAIAHFKTDNKKIKEYLYCYLKNYNFQTMGSTSSIATAVNSKIIKSMPFIIPTDDEIEKFHQVAKFIFEKIRINQIENEKLTQLRDTLLPKLMSGEIDVDKI